MVGMTDQTQYESMHFNYIHKGSPSTPVAPVPREPFSFGGRDLSNAYGFNDITGFLHIKKRWGKKELKDRKKKAEEFIIQAMDIAKEDTFAFAKGGNIRKSVSQSVKPLKKEDVIAAISKLTTDKTQAETITENIYKSRPVSQRTYLKRNKGRSKKDGQNTDI